jgi:thiamine biosynthesis lipoprotein
MACQFQVGIPATNRTAVAAASAALDRIDELESQMTVYDDASEISQVNRMASEAAVPVEEGLFRLLETSLDLHHRTEGAFDIAAGALVKAWGFYRGPKRVPNPDELSAVMECVGSQHLMLDRSAHTIRFDRPGVELNLGAIGKGHALDCVSEMLQRDWNVTSALLHAGQSSVLAIGSFDEPGEEERGWHVAIGDPDRPGESVVSLRISGCALGTSGTTQKYFESGGRRYGHILDPRTGWPACGAVCVSVIAPTAVLADALSTAFFILGPDKAREYCDRNSEIGAVVVSRDPDNSDGVRSMVLGRAEQVVIQ